MSTVEKTNEIVNEVLAKALEAATSTGNFVVDQAPDVVKQLLMYKTFEQSAYLLGFLLLGTLLLSASVKFWNNSVKEDDGVYVPMFLISAVGGVISSSLAFATALDLAKILLAPKIFLIEYAANLIK